jgi:hypothetical protein
LIQLNMALSRTFRIRERTAFQIRGEAFNLPNHLNPGNPTTAGSSNAPLNSALFGLINSDQSGNIGGALQVNAGDYRIVQVAAKIVF